MIKLNTCLWNKIFVFVYNSSLVRVIACHLFNHKFLLEPIINLNLKNKYEQKLHQKILGNCLQTVGHFVQTSGHQWWGHWCIMSLPGVISIKINELLKKGQNSHCKYVLSWLWVTLYLERWSLYWNKPGYNMWMKYQQIFLFQCSSIMTVKLAWNVNINPIGCVDKVRSVFCVDSTSHTVQVTNRSTKLWYTLGLSPGDTTLWYIS